MLNDNYEDAIFTYFDTEGSKIGSYGGKDVVNKSAINNTDYPNVVDTVGMQIVLINQTNITDLPVMYDLREEHLVTPIRDQGYMGSCWAFGMTATLESAVLKSLGIETDFSENNMQNSMLLYSKYGNKGINEGGENIIGVGYLLSWIGAFTMDYDTYDELGKISPFITSCDDLHIQDIIFIPNTPGDETSIKTVKNAILKYGALYAVLNSKASSEDGESNYYNPDTFAQYNPNLNLSNHAICVVGWDDTFSKDNFGIAPPGDGAWIIKNSWGEDWGDSGYFYVSYYDQTLCSFSDAITERFTGIIIENTLPYNKNYQYDISGLTKFYETGERFTYLNIFDAEEDDVIAAVGTYFDSEGVEYEVSIEVNDETVYRQTGVSPYIGYHTIKLDKYVSIKKGDKFIVGITSNAVPLSINSRSIYKNNISYIILADETWEDISEEDIVACLKAYTLPSTIKTDNIIEYYSDCKIFSVDVNVGNVNVEVSINNIKMNATTDENGIGNFTLPLLKPGVHIIETSFNNTTVINTVKVLNTVITPNKLTRGYNTKTNVKATFYNKDGKALANTNINVVYDGKTSSNKTDSAGAVTITVNDKIGTHTLKFTNPSTGEVVTTTIKVVSRFSGNKNINMYYFDGSKFTVKVYGDYGSPVGANQVVTVKLNKKTYKVKTNKNGIATLKIPNTVKPGTYTLTATYKGQTIKNTVKVKQVLTSPKTMNVKKNS